MISMTGFAWRERAGEDITLVVEIKGYNSRFLEMYVNIPSWLSRLEPRVRSLIGGICGRGKVEVTIRVMEVNAPMNIMVNTNAAAAYAKAFSALAAHLGIDPRLDISMLAEMEGVLDVEKSRDDERYWNMIEPVLKDAVNSFQDERVREGKHTEDNILNSVGVIEAALKTIVSHVPNLENSIKENIRARFRELVGAAGLIDENRILAETAVLLMKYTIAEEIARLSSHLGEFRAEAVKNERPGKKLDFLCQEINREVNTIGSKSTILEVSRAVVEMKESLENIREQLRNVE